VRVVTSNLHAGVDGWGRPTAALAETLSLAPDIVICPEVWRGDEDFVATLSARGYQGHYEAIASAQRVSSGALGGRRWQPRSSHLTGERGLYYGEYRKLTWWQRRSRVGQSFESGTWGLGLFATRPLRKVRVVPLGRLPRERAHRFAILASVDVEGNEVTVIAVHAPHLTHGSPLWFRRLRRLCRDVTTPIVLAGDFNAWTPLVRLLLPGFVPRARGRTWPSPHPHSQIDHVLTRGNWRATASGTLDTGSDHLALYVDLALDSSSS